MPAGVPFVPQSHPFVERLIGTLRREYLDHLFFWNGIDLERKLLAYCDYYNHQLPYRIKWRNAERVRVGRIPLLPAYAVLTG